MRAAVYTQFGPPEVVQLQEVAQPVPGPDEVLVRIAASTITAADWRARSLTMPPGFGLFGRLAFGLFGPRKRVLGMEFSGEVEAVGAAVTKFKRGDRVFGSTGMRFGCHAEFQTVSQDGVIALMPAELGFAEAASLTFGGSAALHFLQRCAALKRGERVLVVGASGSVGSSCVQLAKHLGAEVTAVCSGGNADLVRSIGADHVIDYQQEDFTKRDQKWDVIVDTAGTTSFDTCAASLNEGGRLCLVLAGLVETVKAPFRSKQSGKRVFAGPAAETTEDLAVLSQLAVSGALRPLVDRRYALEDVVQAHAYVDTGRKRGNVVIELQPPAGEGGAPTSPS